MTQKSTEKECPVCKTEISLYGLYWCNICKKWYEEIDFLNPDEEYDEDCKKCYYLAKTKFKKNNQFLHYCNSLDSLRENPNRRTEKIRDFRKCSAIKYINLT